MMPPEPIKTLERLVVSSNWWGIGAMTLAGYVAE